MKKLMMLVCVGLVVGAVAEVEYGSLTGNTQSVTIAEGEIFTVMANNFNVLDGYDVRVYPPSSSTWIELSFYHLYQDGITYDYHIQHANTPDFGTIAGPCMIKLANGNGYCSYKISRHEVTANPMNIVSLPDDNDGDVDLLVETSTDLITWTPVYSGSAGTSNSAAFIRTRLIQN